MTNWPALDSKRDRPTIIFLHLVSQIVGKVPTKLIPWRNHGWHLTLHVTPRGLRTETIHVGDRSFALTIDLVSHEIVREGPEETADIALRSASIAQIHQDVLGLLAEAGLPTRFNGVPNEIEPATPFAEDRAERSYDPDCAARLHGALLAADRVFRHFRSGFLGKVSPVHFFWGSFDLAVTRFSGRAAPPHPGGIANLPDAVTREAYSHEVSSAGFWPGGAGGEGGPFFYSYAYPTPEGFAAAKILPAAARFDDKLGEFILDYTAVAEADDPDRALLDFLESSYRAAARLGRWDEALDCALGRPGVPRPL